MAKQILDRAAEWIGENYPELDGSEYEAMLSEVAEDLEAIDAWFDENNGRVFG